MFSSSPTRSSLSCPPFSGPSDVPCFQAHECTPPSSSPSVGESLFATCHVSQLSNPLLPLPPLHLASPLLPPPLVLASLSRSLLFLPPSSSLLLSDLPPFDAHHLSPPSASPPVSESSFMPPPILEPSNPLLPLPPLQLVSPR